MADLQPEQRGPYKLTRLGLDPVDAEHVIQQRPGQGKKQTHGHPSQRRPGVPFVQHGVHSREGGQRNVPTCRYPVPRQQLNF